MYCNVYGQIYRHSEPGGPSLQYTTSTGNVTDAVTMRERERTLLTASERDQCLVILENSRKKEQRKYFMCEFYKFKHSVTVVY